MTTTNIGPGFRHRAPRHARRAAGESRRKDVPLEEHALLCPDDERADPIDILTGQDRTRVQQLVPIRHGRMSRTPFTFLRGAAAVMADDLSRTPSTDMRVQLCGDAHLSNFGVFNSPDRRLVFDVNDFDETLPGPFEWDIKRLAASVTVAARNNGLSDKKVRNATLKAVEGYRCNVDRIAKVEPLDVHYFRIEFESLMAATTNKKGKKRAEKLTRKATKKNSMRAQRKLTDIVDGRRVIVPDPPLVDRVDALVDVDGLAALSLFFEQYRSTLSPHRRAVLDRYSVVDVAHKVVGVGSVGTRCLIVLLESGDGGPLFLQFKEATASVLEPYAGASEYELSGQRVVEGQRLTQATGDIFLGWARFEMEDRPTVDFYFRQLWDGKGSIDVETMGPKALGRYARACGQTLALAHGRSGDASMIAGYLGDEATFDHAVADWAMAYADRTESDHAAHVARIDAGDIAVIRDI